MTDFDNAEDSLNILTAQKVLEDEEEDEGGAGVDYRRMFKRYSPQFFGLTVRARKEKKQLNLPKRGEKDFEPDGTGKQLNLLQEGRDAMYSALSFDAGLKHGAACGVWIEEYEMTHVPRALCTGPWFQTTGIGGPTGTWLLPEETLLMVSSGRMELRDEDGFDMGVMGAWGACIEPSGGVNAYLIYSQLRRAGYFVYRPGILTKTSSSPTGLIPGDPVEAGMAKRSIAWIRRWSNICTVLSHILLLLQSFFTSILSFLPSWLIPRPHRPYDKIYAALPPIPTYSTLLFKSPSKSPPLKIAFQAWRPSPQWKRRAPGPPDFHVCVVDSRDPFPTLHQLEGLYTSVARDFALGKGGGKVVLAVVDRGVSNYLSLDDTLGGDTR